MTTIEISTVMGCQTDSGAVKYSSLSAMILLPYLYAY